MLVAQTETTLKMFNKYIVQQARSILTKQDHSNSKKLYDSLKGFVKVMPNSFELSFEMEDYGKFQDLGVKGKSSSTKAPNSPYKFGTGSGKKGGLTDGITNWVKAKGFQFRDRQTGKFLSFDQTAFLITRSIYQTGLKPLNFFSVPFERAFERLPPDLLIAYGLDIETFLKNSLKNGEKSRD